jgi:branched-chain amino acid transport system substrate-binding protein
MPTLLRKAAIALAIAFALGPFAASGADAPLRIDVITSLSGSGAFSGANDKQTLGIGEELVNKTGGIRGRPLQFVFSDDESKPQVDVQLLNGILSANPIAVIGPRLVAGCSAMMPLLRNGPVDYCISPGIFPENGSFVFTGKLTTRDVQDTQVRYFRLRGWERIALIASTDASGQDGEHALDETLALPENSGVKLVARAHFNVADVSVAAQAAQIKAANPQVVIVWTTGTPLGTVLNGFSQAGLDIPVGVSYGNMTYGQFDGSLAGVLPKETYIAATPWMSRVDGVDLPPAVQAAKRDFYRLFKAHGVTPDMSIAGVWDPMLILVSALRKLGPDATPGQVRDYIMHLKGFAGVNGAYDFEKYPQRGLGAESAVMTRWSPAAKTWDVVSKPTGIPLKGKS